MYGIKRFCPHLNESGVGSVLVQTNAIQARHVASGVVTVGRLADYGIGSTKIATNAIGGRALAPLAVQGSHIVTDTINGRTLADRAVSAVHLATDAVASHLYGNKTFWEDIQTPGIAIGKKNSAPELEAFKASGGLLINKFEGGTDEQVYADYQLYHGVQDPATLYAHVHWLPVDAGTGYVRWRLEYSWAKRNDVFPDPTIVSVIATAPGVAWKHTIHGFPVIAGVSGLSAILKTRLFRAGTSDTYSTDVGLLFFDIHVAKDQPGSRQQYVK